MAGHNKWSKVKHRKAVVDKRRSKAWTMCSRAIMVAAKLGGPDPEFNFALRQALDDAKYHNVPKDNVDRAIKKGAGGGEEVRFLSRRAQDQRRIRNTFGWKTSRQDASPLLTYPRILQ